MQIAKRDMLVAAYAAFNQRDIDAVLVLMTPDVDWPNGMEGGRVVGHDQVRAYWTQQWNVLDPRVEPISIEEDQGGRMVVRVHQVVCDLSGNILINHQVEHVYSFSGGFINRMDIREFAPASSGSAAPDTGGVTG